jgi:transposase
MNRRWPDSQPAFWNPDLKNGARCREFYEDRNVRISILARGTAAKPDTLQQTDDLAFSIKPLADGAGHTLWYLSNGVSKEFFEALLETFAREAEAGLSRIILLGLDNAGWHGPANLKIPDGIRLIHLPPYSPELQPAETLWPVVDEPIVNKHIATIEELDAKIAQQCVALTEQPEQIQSRTNFRWWPKPIIPN